MRKLSNEQSRKLRDVPLDVTNAAWWQCHGWLKHFKQVAAGLHHYREPRIRPGQWVRFIGNPDEVQLPCQFNLRVGSFGQVWRRVPGCHRLYVAMLGSTALFRFSPYELEPLVGTPIGRPSDHLRKVKRRTLAYWRTRATIHGGQ